MCTVWEDICGFEEFEESWEVTTWNTRDITAEFIGCEETIKTEIKQEINLYLVDPITIESELGSKSSSSKLNVKN